MFFHVVVVNVDNQPILLQLCDTAGQVNILTFISALFLYIFQVFFRLTLFLGSAMSDDAVGGRNLHFADCVSRVRYSSGWQVGGGSFARIQKKRTSWCHRLIFSTLLYKNSPSHSPPMLLVALNRSLALYWECVLGLIEREALSIFSLTRSPALAIPLCFNFLKGEM